MILIEVTNSESCRDWEGNSSDIFEFDGTLREYLIEDNEIQDNKVGYILDGAQWKRTGFGFMPGGNEEDGYDYEGVEVTLSYRILRPSRKFVEMLMRHVEEQS